MSSSVPGEVALATARPVSTLSRLALMELEPTSNPRRYPLMLRLDEVLEFFCGEAEVLGDFVRGTRLAEPIQREGELG